MEPDDEQPVVPSHVQVLGGFSRRADAYRSLPTRLNHGMKLNDNTLRLPDAGSPHDIPAHTHTGQTTSKNKAESYEANSSFSSNDSNELKEFDCNINDCLQDLDKYLEEIDTKSIIFQNDNEQSIVQFSPNESLSNSDHNEPNVALENLDINGEQAVERRMQRTHHLRRTVNPTHRRVNSLATHNESDQSQLWRCKSARELTSSQSTESRRSNDILTQEQIFSNILNECSHEMETRPRQFGRRATGQPTILALRASNLPSNRPSSAPSATVNSHHLSFESSGVPLRANETIASSLLDSEGSSFRSSHMASPFSSGSATDSSSSSFSTEPHNEIITSPNVHEQSSFRNERLSPSHSIQREQSDFYNTDPLGTPSALSLDCNAEWPHTLSQLFALTSCTLGLCNLCRFCVLVINYGGSFVLQFFVLSILFGIPLFWLLMLLGHRIKGGPISMWSISPICKGIGIALLLVQFVIAIYSSVSIAWICIYIRDTFPKSYEFSTKFYRIQENGLSMQYIIQNLTKDVSEYFNIDVLQRLDGEKSGFKVSDQLALYLSIVWTTLFVVLCRGLRSLGKFIYLLATVPVVMFIVIVVKMVFFMDSSNVKNLFSTMDVNDFAASQSWIAAAQETFLTWGLLGPSVIALTCRRHKSDNKYTLRRNALIVVLVTFLVLFCCVLLALCSMSILRRSNLFYIPGSYDNPGRYTSIYSKTSVNPELLAFPPMLVPHYSSYLGEVYRRPFGVAHNESGYQALRFISEIFPAVVGLSSASFSWVWVFLTLAMFLLFGLSQLCVMWKPISCILGDSTSSVLLSCVAGLMLSIPFATEMGIRIIHYTDLLFGASWIVPILWTLLIFGVFLIRGRPYNGDDLVNDLKMSTSISAFLALAWNIMLPIGLPTLSVISFKASNSKQFYNMNGRTNISYWARNLAGSVQLSILLIVPIVAIIQIFRYLSKGPLDLFDRIQLLYRPPENSADVIRGQQNSQSSGRNGQSRTSTDYFPNMQPEDSPPKYTPPPSYTTATGARIAKFIRQSIRRSVRRIRSASNYTRPSTYEPEAEMIVPDLPNTQRSAPSNYTVTVEDSIDAPFNESIESSNFQDSSVRASFRQRHKDLSHRVASLPRIMQHSALINEMRIRPSSLTSRVHSDNTSSFRSIDNLTQNAEPPAQSHPPGSDSFENSQSSS